MSNLIKISEACTLAFHAMAFIASNPEHKATATALADACLASNAHMMKVCQRLAKAGFLKTRRGVGGGFALVRPADQIFLSDIYALFEGPMSLTSCMLASAACKKNNQGLCIFGERLQKIQGEIIRYFQETRLSDIAARCHVSPTENPAEATPFLSSHTKDAHA